MKIACMFLNEKKREWRRGEERGGEGRRGEERGGEGRGEESGEVENTNSCKSVTFRVLCEHFQVMVTIGSTQPGWYCDDALDFNCHTQSSFCL